MSREIKFRAFDLHNKVMVLPEMLFMNDESDGGAASLFTAMGNLSKNYELLQFTGLTDKNGKEAYDKDFVKHVTGKIMLISFGEFNVGRDDFGMYFKAVGWHIVFNDGGKYPILQTKDRDVYGIALSDCEIIGNIYENPELINNKDTDEQKQD